jgi:hypothetical protein
MIPYGHYLLDLVISYRPHNQKMGPWFARWYVANQIIDDAYIYTHAPTFHDIVEEMKKWLTRDQLPLNRIFVMRGMLNEDRHVDFMSAARKLQDGIVEIDSLEDDDQLVLARLSIAEN